MESIFFTLFIIAAGGFYFYLAVFPILEIRFNNFWDIHKKLMWGFISVMSVLLTLHAADQAGLLG